MGSKKLSAIVISKVLQGSFKQNEIGEIPENWDVFPLNEISNVIDSLHQTPEFSTTGFPMVRVTDIKGGYLDLNNAYRVSEEVYKKFTKNHSPQKGDIVVSRVGSYGMMAYVDTDENFCLGQNTAIINPKINGKYLFYVLQSNLIKSQIDIQVDGSSQKTLSLKNIKDLKVIVPPLVHEQEKIASILSSVDEAIASTQAVIDQTRKVKHGLLQQLLTRGIGHTRFKDSAIGQIPEAWEVKTAGEVCQLITKGTTPRDGNFSKELGDVPYLRVQNLTFDGRLNFYVNSAFISSEIHNGELKRSRTFPGDVLINIVGPPLGKISVVTSEYPEWNINQAIAIFRTSSNYNNKLLAYWLQTPQVLDWFLCRSKKTTSQQNLTLQLCNELPVPLASLSEQYQIVERLESIDFQIHTENESLLTLVNLKRGLMQDLLTGRVRVKTLN